MSFGITASSALTLTSYLLSACDATRAIFNFSRTFPDRYSSAVAYSASYGFRNILFPLRASISSSTVFPVNDAIYSMSTLPRCDIEYIKASSGDSADTISI